MKKFFCVLLALSIFSLAGIGLLSSHMAYAGGVEVCTIAINIFKAGTNTLTVGEPHMVFFEAEWVGAGFKPSHIPVYDEDGQFVANLCNNKENNALYTAAVELQENERKTIAYHTQLDGIESVEWEIVYYNMATEDDFAVHDELWGKIAALENRAESYGLSDEAITNAAHKLVTSDPSVQTTE